MNYPSRSLQRLLLIASALNYIWMVLFFDIFDLNANIMVLVGVIYYWAVIRIVYPVYFPVEEGHDLPACTLWTLFYLSVQIWLVLKTKYSLMVSWNLYSPVLLWNLLFLLPFSINYFYRKRMEISDVSIVDMGRSSFLDPLFYLETSTIFPLITLFILRIKGMSYWGTGVWVEFWYYTILSASLFTFIFVTLYATLEVDKERISRIYEIDLNDTFDTVMIILPSIGFYVAGVLKLYSTAIWFSVIAYFYRNLRGRIGEAYDIDNNYADLIPFISLFAGIAMVLSPRYVLP